MDRKKLRWIIIGLLAVVVAIIVGVIIAANNRPVYLTKEYEYTTSDKNDTSSIPNTITVDGQTYKLATDKEITYEIENTTSYVQQILQVEFNSMDELEQTRDFVINGRTYTLEMSSYDIKEKPITRTVTVNVDYPNQIGEVTSEDIPTTKTITVSQNGVDTEMEATLESITRTAAPRWVSDLVITGTFEGTADTEYFDAFGHELSVNADTPTWDGYKTDILKDKNLSTSLYRITSAKWTSTYKKTSGTTYQRKAAYYGSRYVADYQAVYKLEYDATGYAGTVTYMTTASVIGADPADVTSVYTMKATVTYQLAK